MIKDFFDKLLPSLKLWWAGRVGRLQLGVESGSMLSLLIFNYQEDGFRRLPSVKGFGT